MPEEKKYTIPLAIVAAGILIAGAIYLTNRPNSAPLLGGDSKDTVGVPVVSADDHILGNPDAKIVIVEYSDFECPYCKVFHKTMHQVIDAYGKDGKVAWVYRHFPIEQLHSKAKKEAQASECAAELGGNTAFWAYADRLFEVTPSNDNLDLALLPTIAEEVGLDKAAFESCLASTRHTDTVDTQYADIVSAGGRGTPHNVVMVGGEQASIEGAQTYATMRQVIEALLNNSDTQGIPALR